MPSVHPSPDLIIFGGAFDPPHRGHQQCIDYALKEFPDTQLWIVPAQIPAGSAGRHKTPAASITQRIEMCKIICEGRPRTSVSSIESELPSPNYTVKTLQFLHNENPNRSLGLMIGQDQLQAFPLWHSAKEILRLADLIVVRRRQFTKSAPSLQVDANATLQELNLAWRAEGNLLRVGSNCKSVILIDGDICNAESSVIRERLRTNQPLPADWLPATLLQYITATRLYSEGDHR